MARTRSASAPSIVVAPGGRVLSLSVAWYTDGARRREEARRGRRCVECGSTLPTRRTPYCSPTCRWKFHGHYFWDAARIYVKRRDRYTCAACHHRFRSKELEVDHILEIVRGGAALEYSNLQTMCRPCHRGKTEAFRRMRASARSTAASGSAGVGE
ncbi:MAG: HNH endonuclease [Thermoplasmata archaeon]